MQVENYIGLKYKEKGRDLDGLDCWGLVRLFYKNEFKIDLPSFSSEYTQEDTHRIEELIAQYKEGWESQEKPQEGSIVLFRILGTESHVGVVINEEQFLHIRENQDSVIENFSSAFWKKRVVGFFKYSQNKNAILNAVPHPLRTERYTMPVLPGTTLDALVKGLNKEYNVPQEIKSSTKIIVNGRIVEEKDWHSTILCESDTIEYRAVPKGSAGRLLALVAIAIIAPYIANAAAGAFFSSVGVAGGATAFSVGAVYAGTYAATMLVGTALVNAIAPIRPPVDNSGAGSGADPGSAERQLMVTGGANRANPYGAIPVVLGKVRLTPPLASVNYLTYEKGRDSYLSMLLAWGYGPVVVYNDTLKIGDVPLTNFTDYNYITAASPGTYSEQAFKEIYGSDVDPDQKNLELICDGNPENETKILTGSTSTYTIDVYDVEYGWYSTSIQGINIDLSTNVIDRNFRIEIKNHNGNFSYPDITGVSNLIISDSVDNVRTIQGIIRATNAKVRYNYLTGNYEGIVYSTLNPGPTVDSSTTQPDSYKAQVAIHFPQGLRKVAIKGASAGSSLDASVTFGFSRSQDGINWTYMGTKTVSGIKKDAFTEVFSFQRSAYLGPSESWKYIRINRLTGDNTEDNEYVRYYHQSVLLSVTYVSNQKPAIDPNNTFIAKTALRIKATDQLNGNTEGINALVQTQAMTWQNGINQPMVLAATNNPAALFMHVLQHPANPKRITNASTQINLSQVAEFYQYCEQKGFQYNSVLAATRSVLDVLRDICAAGRASPAIIDGKWTVIIDKVRTNVIQHFTPHNSWGFEGNKPLPKRPDGLKINFFDEDNGFQENEIIVYDTDKGTVNSSLFETISLPGVTKKSLVIDHAKWHMAQVKLRPEVYTLNVDIEYLVCNRGDLVKVTHDVPMWGLGSGRIKNVITATKLELDESVPMKAGVSYSLRVRKDDGSSVTATVTAKSTDGLYSEIDLTSIVPSNAVLENTNLFLFGEMLKESQDLIVLSVEPSSNKTARLTLVDYGVTDQYNIFTDYLNLSSSTIFESQISQTPRLIREGFGNAVPTITTFVSDESVMEQISKGVFRYNMSVGYYNPYQLPTNIQSVQAQYDLLSSTESTTSKYASTDYQTGGISIPDVIEGETYKVRMRYVSLTGAVGNWSEYSNHTVVGKSNPPEEILASSISAVADKTSGQIIVSWPRSPEIDVSQYEIRKVNNGFGTDTPDLLFLGDNTSTMLQFKDSFTYYIKPLDYFGNYSVIGTTINYTAQLVKNPTNFSFNLSNTSLTNLLCVFSWKEPLLPEFNIAYYEFSYDTVVEKVQTTSFSVQASWIGNKTFTVKSVDIHGRKSSGISVNVEKVKPNPPTNLRAQVIDNTVMLYWNLPTATTLPIDHILIKRGPSWASPDFVIGQKKGEFTTSIENAGGQFTYWLAAVDTSNVQSDPVPVTTLVSEPPDFVFHGDFNSSFNQTKINCYKDNDSLVAPVNTTETWAQHFTSRGWNTIQDQTGVSNTNYPYYAQPTTSTSYYEEVFVSTESLNSSRVLVIYSGDIIIAPITIVPSISVSATGADGSYTTYDGTTSIYATNFKYIKVRLTINGGSDKSLYKLNSLYVKLDAKLKTDADKVIVSSTSAQGTIVNFNREFIDVQSISVSANGTGFLNPVYNFKDNLVAATYSVSSNSCTVSSNNHGLVTGQKVKLMFSSGTGIENSYLITSHTSNSFTVNMQTSNTTNSNCRFYPESFTVFIFDSNGNQVTGEVSWSVSGY